MSIAKVLHHDSALLRGYITWGGLLLLKMLLMALFTGFQRMRSGAVDNPEDCATSKKAEIKKDERVERVRRAHMNDLENIPAFLLAAFFYILSEPDVVAALVLIRIAVIARILHTIVYAVYPVRQPARFLCFFTCLGITIFMIIWSICCLFQI